MTFPPRILGKLTPLVFLVFAVIASPKSVAQGAVPDHFTRMQALDCSTVSNASPAECEALRDIYFASDGANWFDANNWGTSDISSWARVQVAAGQVITLQLDRGQSGPLSPSIANLQNLILLSLNAPFTGVIPDAIGNLSNLEQLMITNTNFSGSIPASFSGLSNLNILVVSSNDNLGGNLPAELGQLSTLEVLRIGGGQFDGSIPVQWSGLTTLREISITQTSLGGEIPAFFANIPDGVVLHDNQFTGLIPAEFGNDIATPDDFRVHRNRLTADANGDALLHTAGLRAWFANQGFVGSAVRRLIGAQAAMSNPGGGLTPNQHAVPAAPLWALLMLPIFILGFVKRASFGAN